MSPIEDVIKLLEQDGLTPVLEATDNHGQPWYQIKWKDKSGSEYTINQDDIAIDGKKLAWFESDHWSYHRLTIVENDDVFSWEPKTYNPVFGCLCLLLEWYKGHLIFIYQEKHDIYICSVIDKKINYFNFHGEDIERKGDLISFDTYGKKDKDEVKIIKIPALELQTPIPLAEAERLGLVPTGLNRPGDFLSINFVEQDR